MLLPEPIRGAELNIRWINLRDLAKPGNQLRSSFAFLNAECDVGDPILDRADVAGGQGQKAIRISLRFMKEVSVTVLQCVTVG